MGANGSETDWAMSSIAAGSSHSVAVLSNGGIASKRISIEYGSASIANEDHLMGEDGQLGHGNASDQHRPCIVHALEGLHASTVVCGAEFSIALCPGSKSVYSWGWGDFGRLGHGDCNDVFIPRPISCLEGREVASVACGDTHTLVVLSSGRLLSFGRNQNGQLGIGTNTDCLKSVAVCGLDEETVTGAACGAEHSACVTACGRVFAWGWGRYGNLGTRQYANESMPVQMEALEGVHATAVSCGWRHTLVVDDSGRLFTCGWSKYGQLGHGDWMDQNVAMPVQALRGHRVVAAHGGWRHTVAATREKLFAWGWNKFGQLGLGKSDNVNVPTEITALSNESSPVVKVACGWKHTIAIDDSGSVYAWGRGTNGQLGVPTSSDVLEPLRIDHLCKGHVELVSLEDDLSESARMFVPACDRYAVVPGNEDGLVVPDAMAEDDPTKRQRIC